METKWVKAKNGRMVRRTFISDGERVAIAIVIGLCFVAALVLMATK